MKLRVALALFACVAGIAVRANDEDVAIGEDASDEIVSSAVIESCAGWRLNKLPEVKKFLTDDFEVLFENTKFKKVPGKSPELKFFNQHGEELEKMDISRLTRSELNKLMDTKGIPRKPSHDEV